MESQVVLLMNPLVSVIRFYYFNHRFLRELLETHHHVSKLAIVMLISWLDKELFILKMMSTLTKQLLLLNYYRFLTQSLYCFCLWFYHYSIFLDLINFSLSWLLNLVMKKYFSLVSLRCYCYHFFEMGEI